MQGDRLIILIGDEMFYIEIILKVYTNLHLNNLNQSILILLFQVCMRTYTLSYSNICCVACRGIGIRHGRWNHGTIRGWSWQ